jgi:hypothetical protein
MSGRIDACGSASVSLRFTHACSLGVAWAGDVPLGGLLLGLLRLSLCIAPQNPHHPIYISTYAPSNVCSHQRSARRLLSVGNTHRGFRFRCWGDGGGGGHTAFYPLSYKHLCIDSTLRTNGNYWVGLAQRPGEAEITSRTPRDVETQPHARNRYQMPQNRVGRVSAGVGSPRGSDSS